MITRDIHEAFCNCLTCKQDRLNHFNWVEDEIEKWNALPEKPCPTDIEAFWERQPNSPWAIHSGCVSKTCESCQEAIWKLFIEKTK